MYEFETFAYLEVPKTASSFICNALTKFCKENKVRKTGHFGPPGDYDPSKFYFISVRDPLDLYISLYSFGCTGKGKLRARMQAQGLGGLYDRTWNGFEFWLRCVLHPANKYLLEPEYRPVAEWVGYQSYRVLSLAIPDFAKAAQTCESAQDLGRLYEERNAATYTIRFESLREDLGALFTGRLRDSMRFRDALAYIRDAPPLNASERIDQNATNPELGTKTKKVLYRREWVLRDYFGYGLQPAKRSEAKNATPMLSIGSEPDWAEAATSGLQCSAER